MAERREVADRDVVLWNGRKEALERLAERLKFDFVAGWSGQLYVEALFWDHAGELTSTRVKIGRRVRMQTNFLRGRCLTFETILAAEVLNAASLAFQTFNHVQGVMSYARNLQWPERPQ